MKKVMDFFVLLVSGIAFSCNVSEVFFDGARCIFPAGQMSLDVSECLGGVLAVWSEILKSSDENNELESLTKMSEKMASAVFMDGLKHNLVDKVDFGSPESREKHGLSYDSNCEIENLKKSYCYPDGINVPDCYLVVKNGTVKFHLKNIVKGRKTLLVFRTICSNPEHKYALSVCKNVFETRAVHDDVSRLRNIVFEIPTL